MPATWATAHIDISHDQVAVCVFSGDVLEEIEDLARLPQAVVGHGEPVLAENAAVLQGDLKGVKGWFKTRSGTGLLWGNGNPIWCRTLAS
jgi:hypothetical protein